MSVPVPEYDGCLWPVDTACLTDEWEAMSPEVQDRALALASSTLRRLTGNRVGTCLTTVRPCRPLQSLNFGSGALGYWHGGYTPFNWNGVWSNVCLGVGIGCNSKCEVLLPRPVGPVSEVKVDGVVISPSDYRVDNAHILVWQGSGDCPFPQYQDLSKPDTEVGTFSVTYLNAYPVDALGAYAAGILAMEYAKACSGRKCRLPSNVTTVVRQGVTMELQPGSFPNGQTGIREVDTFIAMWNPQNIRQATVWSPDLPQHRLQTGGL